MAGDAAVREKVGRVGEDEIDRLRLDEGQDGQGVTAQQGATPIRV